MDDKQKDFSAAILKCAAELGFLMLKSGAEIYRVEESLQRFLLAHQIKDSQIFAIPSLVIISFTDPQGQSRSQIRRIFSRSTDICKVEQLNDLCRRACSEPTDCKTLLEEMHQIAQQPPAHPFPLRLFGSGLIGFGFALMFGASVTDAFCAFLSGLILYIVLQCGEKLGIHNFFALVASSFSGALAALGLVALGIGGSLDQIIISAFMSLVPGLAITNFMRDIITGDLIAGLYRITEVLLTAFSLALGAALAISIFSI